MTTPVEHPTHEELLPPPQRVRVTVYDPKVGHIDVAPLGYEHHEDKDYLGDILVGQDKRTKRVNRGDAIIEYPGRVFDVMPAANVPAYFKPLVSDAPALPERTEPPASEVLK